MIHSLNQHLQEQFGEKVIKLSLDGGFSCPNRDGTIGSGGCLFCSEQGSGEFAGRRDKSISKQIEEQRRLLSPKWGERKAIAYFQNFTNTHAPVETLRALYEEAITQPGIVGLAIATRPDCLSSDVLDVLSEFRRRTFLWVELGLQTKHEHTATLIRRGYQLPVFDEAVKQLRAREIETVAHLILGLPGEGRKEAFETISHLNQVAINGIKIQALQILRDSPLYDYYQQNPFPIMEKEDYIVLVADLLEFLDPKIVIHRMTGDGDRRTLFLPEWSLEKKRVYTGILSELRRRGSAHGKTFVKHA